MKRNFLSVAMSISFLTTAAFATTNIGAQEASNPSMLSPEETCNRLDHATGPNTSCIWNSLEDRCSCQRDLLLDIDDDGIVVGDNCPGVYNPQQTDCNGNGVGAACEEEPPEICKVDRRSQDNRSSRSSLDIQSKFGPQAWTCTTRSYRADDDQGYLACQDGYRLISGGCAIYEGDTTDEDLLQSYPSGNGWYCGSSISDRLVEVYAYCCK